MDNFLNFIQILAAFISTILLPVILIRSKKKKAEAEAERSQADNITAYAVEWKRLYDEKEEKVKELDAKIDGLYESITQLRERLRESSEKNTELAIQNKALEFRKCNKRGCPDRLPPSDF